MFEIFFLLILLIIICGATLVQLSNIKDLLKARKDSLESFSDDFDFKPADKNEIEDSSWVLSEVADRVFLLKFKNHYDLAMTFLRYQEYYECSNSSFRLVPFKIIDFIDFYSKQNDGVFTYAEDWSGFNIPGNIFYRIFEFNLIPDWNKFDYRMFEVIQKINESLRNNSKKEYDFYLIGCIEEDIQTMDHEIAHSFYSLYPDYKLEMNTLLQQYPVQNKILCESLSEMNYDDLFLADEAQAYFSTGLHEDHIDDFKKKKVSYKKIVGKSEKIFQKWKNEKVFSDIREIAKSEI